jgi:XTP/dITP diphosphohydrolase
MDLRFLTKNEHKLAEYRKLFDSSGHALIKAPFSIDEIQTEDMQALVTAKAVKAFARVKRPIFVDHTGLQFEFFNGFPGGLTEIFWNKLKNDRLSEIVGRSSQPRATAVTLLGYCDGRKVHVFKGSIDGTIAPEPRGPSDFQWDPIFIPDGFSETFAEMGDRKNDISMRRLAVDRLLTHLKVIA